MAKPAKKITNAKKTFPPKPESPPMLPSGACRLHVFFSGHVQGVGLRATVADMALRHAITGWVHNTPDERVEMIAEGKREDLELFLAAIGDEMSRYIRGVDRNWETPTGEWPSFSIQP